MPVLDFHFKPSWQYITVMSAVLGAHCLLLFFLPCPLWVLCLMAIIALTYGQKLLLRYGLLKDKQSIVRVQFGFASCLLHTPQGILPAMLKGESVVTARVSLLLFQLIADKRVLACLVCRDSFLGHDSYRKLRVTLRIIGSRSHLS